MTDDFAKARLDVCSHQDSRGNCPDCHAELVAENALLKARLDKIAKFARLEHVKPSATELELQAYVKTMSDPAMHLEGCHAPSLRDHLVNALGELEHYRKLLTVVRSENAELRERVAG